MKEEQQFEQVIVLSKGYGIVSKLAMIDPDLSIEAKAIYAYFCSFTGKGNTAFPSISKILTDLKIGEDRYYKHLKLLKDKEYISVEKTKTNNNRFFKNVYTINLAVKFPIPYIRGTENMGTNNNILNNNNTNSINNNIEEEENLLDDEYKTIPVSFTMVMK